MPKPKPKPKPLEPHPFAALFPELPPEELSLLVWDIKKRGQLEPIILHEGLILDGRNRYRACQIAGVKPWIEEFNTKGAKGSPEDFVLSRNLRRRHLSVGQKAAIALDWSEQIELNPESEKTNAVGRPKGTVSEAAKYIGISEQRVFEVRQIREANPSLYQEVQAGRRSLNSALTEISLPREDRFHKYGSENIGPTSEELGDGERQKILGHAAQTGGKTAPAFAKAASKKAAGIKQSLPSAAAIEKALARIKVVLGNWFYAEVKARNLIQNSAEIVRLAKLTDAQMREVGPLLKRGWTFVSAFQEVVERLTADDEIRALHTRAVANGEKWYVSSVGNFGHIVVWGAEKDKTLAKVQETLAKPGVR
jgi:ParB-like nuclease family protein